MNWENFLTIILGIVIFNVLVFLFQNKEKKINSVKTSSILPQLNSNLKYITQDSETVNIDAPLNYLGHKISVRKDGVLVGELLKTKLEPAEVPPEQTQTTTLNIPVRPQLVTTAPPSPVNAETFISAPVPQETRSQPIEIPFIQPKIAVHLTQNAAPK